MPHVPPQHSRGGTVHIPLLASSKSGAYRLQMRPCGARPGGAHRGGRRCGAAGGHTRRPGLPLLRVLHRLRRGLSGPLPGAARSPRPRRKAPARAEAAGKDRGQPYLRRSIPDCGNGEGLAGIGRQPSIARGSGCCLVRPWSLGGRVDERTLAEAGLRRAGRLRGSLPGTGALAPTSRR
jgi:hypothetical protein